jgi:hypothetical protein
LTGKKNPKQVGEFVSYQQMTSTWACAAPSDSQDPNAYTEGEEWPACELYDPAWTVEETTGRGYARPFITDHANKVAGYNGEVRAVHFCAPLVLKWHVTQMFGRPVSTKFVQMYSGDVYRSSFFEHMSDNDDLYGLKLKRYMVQAKDLLNCSMNPANCAYYNGAPSGMGNITSAVAAPVWISNPHFCNADPYLIQSIGGMNPNPDIHLTYVDVEPQTGQIGRGMKTVQVVFEMKSYYMASVSQDVVTQTEQYCRDIQIALNIVNETKNGTNSSLPVIDCDMSVPLNAVTSLATPANWDYNGRNDTLYFPAYYCREATQLSEEDAIDLQSQLYDTEEMVQQMSQWCFTIAGFCAAVLVVMLLVRKNSAKEHRSKYSARYQLPADKDGVGFNAITPLLNAPSGTSFT